jgi:hypothetical protein
VLNNILEYNDRLAYHTYFTPYFQSANAETGTIQRTPALQLGFGGSWCG